MAVELADGVTYCCLGDTAIFLDLHRDRYSATSLSRLHDPLAVGDFCRRGLLIGSGELGLTVRPIAFPKPTRMITPSQNRVYVWPALIAGIAMATAIYRLKRNGLARSIGHGRHFSDRGMDPGNSAVAYGEVLRAFGPVDRLIDQNRACLTRSLAIRDRLRRARLDATLVIGVRLHPFSAHAWLQAGEFVLNDTLDRVFTYQPIASF